VQRTGPGAGGGHTPDRATPVRSSPTRATWRFSVTG